MSVEHSESALVRRERYLDRAAELLDLAAESAPGHGREDFVVLAALYDRMAATVTVPESNECGKA
jgi:hypothetical protein